jgi:peroxiredoxin Q/BCP
MSKKIRKKSSRTTARIAAPRATRSPRKTIGKTVAAKATSKASATKSGKASKGASAKASHETASKSLRLSGSPATNSTTHALVEGARAPAFHLPRDGGGSLSSADFAGKKLVLFFYPRANTPGCTREAINFTRLKPDFAAAGIEVVGVSADTVKAQDSFRNKHELKVPLISDEKHETLEAYGAWGEKSMYGKSFLGILRTTVLVGADGRIARIWRNVRVDGHADDVLEAARQL